MVTHILIIVQLNLDHPHISLSIFAFLLEIYRGTLPYELCSDNDGELISKPAVDLESA